MSDKSKIEWTDTTWNPVLGCDKVSAGCKGCYAIRTAWRLQHNPNPKVAQAFEGLTKIEGGKPNWTGRVNFVAERLSDPLGWKKPRRVFVNSQSDLFHDGVTDAQIASVFGVMAAAQQHTFQILTKRPERALQWFKWIAEGQVEHATIRGCTLAAAKTLRESFAKYAGPGARAEIAWPLPNVWLGVSCEDQPTADKRIPQLLQTPAAVRWISAEPLLGSIDIARASESIAMWPKHMQLINWVVAGGESGPGARPMHPDWARSLRDQCKAAGVPYFFKQWGEWMDAESAGYPELSDVTVNKSKRSLIAIDGSQWNKVTIPHEKRDGARIMMCVGKKPAGRKLDGVEHNEYPGGERRA